VVERKVLRIFNFDDEQSLEGCAYLTKADWEEYLYFFCKHPDGEKDIRLNQQCLWLTSVSWLPLYFSSYFRFLSIYIFDFSIYFYEPRLWLIIWEFRIINRCLNLHLIFIYILWGLKCILHFSSICFKLSFYFFEFELHLDIFNIILRVITCWYDVWILLIDLK
jgi:hypothetical protein